MSLGIRLSAAASRDAERIHHFIAASDVQAAAGVLRLIDEAIRLIAAKPAIGRLSDEPGIREWSVPGLPYLVPYRVRDETVEIVRIFHTSQNRPDRWT